MESKTQSAILYSCYYNVSRDGENFVPDHTLSYQISGTLTLNDGSKSYPSKVGALRLVRRNQLLKFVKQPSEKESFKSLSIYFTQEVLKDFSLEYGITADKKPMDNPVIDINSNAFFNNYIQSMLDYQQADNFHDERLVKLKLREGILLLLHADPRLKDILFDFADPYKIDLEAFMNKNFHFNVHLDRFAYLTGRSLASFKRDFEKQFNTTPGRWLLQKRLQEAYYLITTKRKAPSDIYIDLGFEDLSHFSYTFKKQFGIAPSKINQ
ncbi:AraC family transcriptional regulator [Danxiaibacter flavus]|uniref:AraC family transcriptional regulator n=1 Tax=Danxiaibacter flavus TaxID=3049108 RepID=A0ABV3ZI50_9BACT|nr:AraC family transcriptional regulator [Chitinophagaceae bacterium DXS]